jgi:hypothetical protein
MIETMTPFLWVKKSIRNLKSENSQEYGQKPRRSCTFMNSASGFLFFPSLPSCQFSVLYCPFSCADIPEIPCQLSAGLSVGLPSSCLLCCIIQSLGPFIVWLIWAATATAAAVIRKLSSGGGGGGFHLLGSTSTPREKC